MKSIAIAILLTFSVSVSGGVFACDGSKSQQIKSGTSMPATPAPVPAK